MQQHQPELTALGIDAVVVTFESLTIAKSYRRETPLDWPILIDERRELYAAYGMGRGGWWAVFGPSSWPGYLKLLFRGRRLRRPTGDVHQLGGDVLIDPEGTVRLHHVGQKPVDRPAISTLLAVVRKSATNPHCG